MSTVSVPGLSTVQLTYDARGRTSQVVQGGRTYSYTYDGSGNLNSRSR